MSITYYPGYSQVQVSYFCVKQEITDITLGLTTVVSFASNAMVPGMQVIFRIPLLFGCQQLNLILGDVIDADSTSITVDVDSREFDAFVIPGVLPDAYTPPYCLNNSEGLPIPRPLDPPNERGFVGATRNIGAS